jgi:DNA-directed RNA polymerase specialized sigma24 family protein
MEDGEDIVQEALAKAYSSLPALSSQSQILSIDSFYLLNPQIFFVMAG